MTDPVGEIRYRGDVQVRAYRRGTYLGDDYLDSLVEAALGERYRFGDGWNGFAVVSIALYDEPPTEDGAAGRQAR